MTQLTQRQWEILRFIQDRLEASDCPSYKEIAEEFEFNVNAARCHVDSLVSKGRLTVVPGRARSFRVTRGT